MGQYLPVIALGPGFIPTQIVAGYWHTCALSGDAAVKCWGDNTYGQLGYGNTYHIGDETGEMGQYLLEIELESGFIPVQIVAGYSHTCALSAGAAVKCWGYNTYGQLGYGDTTNRGDAANQMGQYLLDIDLGAGFVPKLIVAGGQHNCALSTSDGLKCWGHNSYGQLGYGDVNNRGDEADEMGEYLLDIELASLQYR